MYDKIVDSLNIILATSHYTISVFDINPIYINPDTIPELAIIFIIFDSIFWLILIRFVIIIFNGLNYYMQSFSDNIDKNINYTTLEREIVGNIGKGGLRLLLKLLPYVFVFWIINIIFESIIFLRTIIFVYLCLVLLFLIFLLSPNLFLNVKTDKQEI